MLAEFANQVSMRKDHLAGLSCGLRPRLWLSGFVFLAMLTSSAQETSRTADTNLPDLNPILKRWEDLQDPARFRPYELTREYKVFHGPNKQPISEVLAQIEFVPPDVKTYKIVRMTGNFLGEKMVRDLLDMETQSAKKRQGSAMSRANYDFVFLRRENFGAVPEYVLEIIPKRKDMHLLRGQMWVDASTFRIRRIEGVPTASPSIWLKNIRITLQFALLGGMLVPVSVDAVATVRFFGQYTLASLTIRALETQPTAPE